VCTGPSETKHPSMLLRKENCDDSERRPLTRKDGRIPWAVIRQQTDFGDAQV